MKITYKAVKYTQEIEAIDIRTMDIMSPEDYREYINSGLLRIDHHDVLVSTVAGYPVAANREQLEILIKYLESLKDKIKQASNWKLIAHE
jgi:hypothetical protein